MAPLNFKMYVDDSGTKQYSPTNTYTHGGGDTRYFVFAGLVVDVVEAGVIASRLRELKTNFFGRPDVEIKANWLRRREEREKRFTRKFNIDDQRMTSFSDAVYDLIATSSSVLIACVIDKVHMKEDYGDRAYYPPAAAYEYVLQRAQLCMSERSGRLHVTIDDMDGATPKGNQYRDNLRQQHTKLVKYGSRMGKNTTLAMDRIDGLAFTDSAADERLQLADLVAYAVYRQFVDHGEEWESDSAQIPTYPYLQRVLTRFRDDGAGRVQGFGIVKAPLRARRQWRR